MTPARTAACVLAGVLLLSGAWDAPGIVLGTISLSNEVASQGGDTVRQVCFVLLLCAAVAAGIRARGTGFLLSVPAFVVPVLAWCWLSVLWAIDPSSAVRRIGFTTIVVLSVAYAVEAMPYRQTMGTVLLLPLALHQPGETDPSLVGNWRGLQNHKNEAGAFAALCLILLVHETVRARSRVVGPILVILAGVFLYGTQSKTAGGFVTIALGVGLLAHLSFNNPALRGPMLFGTAAAVVAALPFADRLLSALALMFEDPASLTGRVQIWPVLLAYVADHPLLGSGYGSFWAIGDASPIFDYGGGWVATIDHSHNGYVELLVHTGAIGFVLGVLGLVVVPFYTLFSKPLAAGVSRSLLASILAFGCLHDLLETSLLNRSNPTWVMMLVAYCLLAKAMPAPGMVPRPAAPRRARPLAVAATGMAADG